MNRTGQTYRPKIRVLMTVFLIAGVVGAAMADSEEEQLRQAAYQKIMEKVLRDKVKFGLGRGASARKKPNAYREIKDHKVLSVCIYWSGNRVADFRTSGWWASFSRRGQMNVLRRTTLNNCRSLAKGKGRDCKCQIVDENDRNKLKLPEEWKARVLASASGDFRLANLQGARFMHADLQGFNFKGANLRKANLTGANLQKANLDGASLENAYLQMANLQGATFRNANFHKAMLSAANLQGANLQGADLSGARGLTQGQLDEACGDENTTLPENLTIKPCSKVNK